MRTNNNLPKRQQKYFARLTILIRISYNEFIEYLRWLVIAGDFNDVSPPTRIEAIWRAHIADTQNYRKCCTKIIGKFIEYDPAMAIDTANKMKRLHNTHKRYFEINKEMTAENYDLWEIPYKPSTDRPVVGSINLHMEGQIYKIPLIHAMCAEELRIVVAKIKGIHTTQIVLIKKETVLSDHTIFRSGEDVVDICATLIPDC